MIHRVRATLLWTSVTFILIAVAFTYTSLAQGVSILSDDFNPATTEPNPIWRFYDPYDTTAANDPGQSTLTFTGTNALISIPAGVTHDLWSGPTNKAPRLLQPAPNTDFGIEVKFESLPSAQYQLQGIVVQQTNDIFIRFDTIHSAASPRLFVAYLNGSNFVVYMDVPLSSAPSYGRVIRSGNQWTYRYSNDGIIWTDAVTFTQSLQVTEVGFFAGNHDPNPAFVASVDYFMNLAAPVVDIDVWIPPASQLLSDDFNPVTTEPNPTWRFYDPYDTTTANDPGQSILTFNGTNALISIPAGFTHDLWASPTNKAPRLLQPAPNTDFGIEVKFESLPNARYQVQGIIVQQTNDIFLRFDTVYDGISPRLFAAYINGASDTIYLNVALSSIPSYGRVIRSGNQWTYRYSGDGITWIDALTFTQALTVSEVGFFAGTHDPNPAFVSSVDYFMNLAAPIVDNDSPNQSTPPTITTQPANQTVTAGQTATFSVAATGSGILSYQWQRNGVNVSGATLASHTTPATTAADNGAVFSCIVSNSAGSVTSNPATLTVRIPPTITTQPANQSVSAGQTATFSVVATGSGLLSFQWQRNGLVIAGAGSASYTTPATTSTDNGALFTCIVSNSAGSVTSNPATLTVTASATPPTITTQPANRSVLAGQTATFSVAAAGSGILSYQWQRNGVNLSGATIASYITPATTSTDNGAVFICIVSNSAGSVTSNPATLTVTAGNILPLSDDFNPATTEPNPTWRFYDPYDATAANDPGQSILTFTGTNALISIPAGLTHDPWVSPTNKAPRLLQPAPNTDFGIEVKFESTPIAQYQMQGIIVQQTNDIFLRFDTYYDGISPRLFVAYINSAADTVYQNVALPSIPLYRRIIRSGDQWTYRYSGDGITWTDAATFTQSLTVTEVGFFAGTHDPNPAFVASVDYFMNLAAPIVDNDSPNQSTPPTITAQPANQTVTAGQTATFTVTASGTPPLAYQWQRNGGDIAAATSASYTTPATTAADNGAVFRCIVGNSAGSVTSNPATLSVTAASVLPLSDDFNPATTEPNPAWRFYDPYDTTTASDPGQSILTFNGANALISIPAGLTHDLWASPGNKAPRLLQPAPNTDFGIEVKFESLPSAQYQMQGIIVQQTNDTFLRFDTFHDGISPRLFAAYINGASYTFYLNVALSSAPYYGRVIRSGNQWTYRYSGDGITWTDAVTFTQSLTVTEVGFFAATHDPNPAFVSSVDYFMNLAAPIVDNDSPNQSTPPAITTQPANRNVSAGQTATFSVVATGSAILSYQWQRNGVNVSGATGASYTTPATTSTDNGAVFACIVSNSAGSVTSNPATLTVTASATPPTITTQPGNQSISAGQTATFSIVATGSGTLSYQWLRNGVNISGAISASYTTPATTLTDNGSVFTCSVSNSGGTVTSNPATLAVTAGNTLPLSDDFNPATLEPNPIWRFYDPYDTTAGNDPGQSTLTSTGTNALISIPAGLTHDLWVSPTNNAPRLLQPAPNSDFGIEVKFESAPNARYQLQGIIVQQTNDAFLRFNTGHDGSSPRLFVAYINGANSTIYMDVALSTIPSYGRVIRSGNQWNYRYSGDGVTWTDAVTFTQALSVSEVGFFAGTYIPNPGFVASVDYFMSLAAPIADIDSPNQSIPPIITIQPENQSVSAGQTATFSVLAAGSGTLSYQWQRNTANISGATSASYATPATTSADNGAIFRCIVSNSSGSVTSNPATLTIGLTTGWWDTSFHYRVPIDVAAASYARTNKPVNVTINFTSLLTALGGSGAFNPNSIRVIEVDSGGSTLDTAVPFQFDRDAAYNASSNASGTLVFLMVGNTAANATRRYHVYFDTAGGFSAPSFAPQVAVTDNVDHEGQTSFRIVTTQATYYYHKLGGGFASMEDVGGIDWLNYHVGGGSAGEYRGIPNMGVVGHPGYTNSTSSLIAQGPIKATIQSQSTDGLWRYMWEVYPQYATMTLQQAGGTYWFLYEGTPGGTLNPSTDFWTRSSGQTLTANQSFAGDIPGPEWVYFGDASMNRVLYLAHHEDDALPDQYYQMENNMTVFGFGRVDPCCTRYLTAVPQHLTIGFNETQGGAPGAIDSAFRDLSISTGTPQAYAGSTTPPTITTQPANQYVTTGQTATFSVVATGGLPLSYQWLKNNVAIPGAAGASYTTPATTLADNGSTFRCVVTNSTGSATSNAATLTVTPPGSNQQVTLLDVTYTHTATETTLAPLGNPTGKAFSFFNVPAGIPTNLVSPVNYSQGTVYHRLEVFSKPSTKSVLYQLCIFQDEFIPEKHACGDALRLAFTAPGTYDLVQPLPTFYQYGNLDWSRRLLNMMLVLKDGAGHPVDDRYGFGGTWDGSPDFGLYYPMQVRFRAILVPPGGTFSGW